MGKRQGPTNKYTVSQIIEALRACGGIRFRCRTNAWMLTVDDHKLYQQVPEITRATTEIQDAGLDFAESALMRKVFDDGNPTLQLKAIAYYVRTKGKHRRYSTT